MKKIMMMSLCLGLLASCTHSQKDTAGNNQTPRNVAATSARNPYVGKYIERDSVWTESDSKEDCASMGGKGGGDEMCMVDVTNTLIVKDLGSGRLSVTADTYGSDDTGCGFESTEATQTGNRIVATQPVEAYANNGQLCTLTIDFIEQARRSRRNRNLPPRLQAVVSATSFCESFCGNHATLDFKPFKVRNSR